jgi:hypothetical protein
MNKDGRKRKEAGIIGGRKWKGEKEVRRRNAMIRRRKTTHLLP